MGYGAGGISGAAALAAAGGGPAKIGPGGIKIGPSGGPQTESPAKVDFNKLKRILLPIYHDFLT